jgi:hypothetical protein
MLQYMAGTKEHGLHYAKREEGRPILVGYSNADMAGVIDNRKSMSGMLYFFGKNLITRQSTK